MLDPSGEVEILTAKDLAGRVESLVSVIFPQLINSGLKERLHELEKELGKGKEEIGFIIADEVAHGKFFKPADKRESIEAGMRVAIAYWTLGVTTAPLEGLTQVRIKKRNDGGDYLAIYTAGPIRSAGGTTNAMMALVGDFLRKKFGVGRYDPTPEEIERYYLELESYHNRVTRLQYFPSAEEVRHIIRNIPVELNGEATEQIEVLAYKDLSRVETNRIRGGMVLSLSMIALKASKLIKRTKKYGEKYELGDWGWLKTLVEKKKDVHKTADKAVYIAEIPGGRPVFGYPNALGGFRLRYGRARNTGFAAVGVHPATMVIVDEFIAVGTQLKMELPGKAGAISPVDSIEGPTVKLKDGSVVKVKTAAGAKELKGKVDKILYLGDMLISYGEFLTNGKPLAPPAWCEEWWLEEVKAKRPAFKGVDSVEGAIKLAKETGTALHPKYTYFWGSVTGDEVVKLKDSLDDLRKAKEVLEKLGIEHQVEDGRVLIREDDRKVLEKLLSGNSSKIPGNGLDAINALSPIKIRAKAGRFVGARMGRPEKAERRLLVGKPHTLFPAGRTERMRNIVEAVRGGLRAEVSMRVCPKCSRQSYYIWCERCGAATVQKKRCVKCGATTDADEHCGLRTKAFSLRRINVDLRAIANRLGMTVPPLLKGVRGMSSAAKIPERLEKGLLRAKYDLFVNKDGTVRVDSTDMPLTHFKPREVRVSPEKLKELGYEKDVDGKPLENDDQMLELMPQDVLLSDTEYFSFPDYFIRVSKFIDELLVKFYGLEPFYNIETKDDLIGQLVIGLAPHTSAGIIGRVVGFSGIRSGYAHPAWHAAKKRNCDGDEDSLILLMDALLNFSREFLGTNRGAKTMDVPLVITTILDLLEVDDEVHDMDVVGKYPLEFYRAAEEGKAPWDVKVETLGSFGKLTGTKSTHRTADVEAGPKITAYRSLGPMLEKVGTQLELAEKITAVDENDVASKILSTHFLKDIKGNLRQFSNQKFRCVKCNTKYRRFPIIGKCEKCGGRIILTVHEGTIKKYYESSVQLAKKYEVSEYIRSQLRLLERKLDLAFGVTEKQEDLDQWLK